MTEIPLMTDPLGKYWEQPLREEILVDDTHAIMTKKSLSQLKDYSLSQPTGTYQGKMWKIRDCIIFERGGEKYRRWTGDWILCWFGPDPKDEPGYVGNYYRQILIID
jgi:hypothetical protein